MGVVEALKKSLARIMDHFTPQPAPGPLRQCPLKLRIIEILGLYQPGHDDRAVKPPGTTRGSGYKPGYLSVDDKGRIFINHTPAGVWTKNVQYVEITVVIEPSNCTIPPGTKVRWTFDDPDDPTNEGRDVHPDAGKILDPNDYSGSSKTGAMAADNDPNGGRQSSPRWEQVDPKFALSGNETLIDTPTHTSKVRFHISDIAGDNWRVKAELAPQPSSGAASDSTGIMTAWNKIDLEYVRMASAGELPVEQIARYYDKACVQVDVSLKRVVSGASDLSFMGADEGSAYGKCESYVKKSSGEFSKEGEKGWFFIVAANRMQPARTATILYEGDAHAQGASILLPVTLPTTAKPRVVRIFDKSKVGGFSPPKPNDKSIHIKFRVTHASNIGSTVLFLEPHDFHAPDDPDNALLDADLSHYGIAAGQKIPVQVLSDGDEALVTGGISPGGAKVGGKHYFGGRLIVFTKSVVASDQIITLCHELCHAFDNAHKCGNWSWVNLPDRKSCCMNYWFQFVLDDAPTRAPIPWSQNRNAADLCAPHIRRMRDYHLEDNPGLGWGFP